MPTRPPMCLIAGLEELRLLAVELRGEGDMDVDVRAAELSAPVRGRSLSVTATGTIIRREYEIRGWSGADTPCA